jgi:hypothetical protein
MRWLAGQQRALDRIEQSLLAGDQDLGSLFAYFRTLAGDDAMPRTERLQPGRLPRLALLVSAGLIAAAMFLLTLFAPGRSACPAAAVITSGLSSPAARPAPGCRAASSASREPGKRRRPESAAPDHISRPEPVSPAQHPS